jgi:acid stress-induced BolA-like protein IbaG/YrbA
MRRDMASTPNPGDVVDLVRRAIEGAIADAQAEVTGGGGHFSIVVVSPVFAGKSTLESHRMVLGAIKHLMAGDAAPVHAVDSLRTRAP